MKPTISNKILAFGGWIAEPQQKAIDKNIGKYLEDGWLVKDLKTVVVNRNIYYTVVIEKTNEEFDNV
jgi:hypothetical protein